MTTTTSRLRAFTGDDYPAWVAGSNLCYPDYPWSVEEARHDDDKWDHSRFFIAATAGVKESMADGVEFTKKRGWVEVMGFARQPAWIGLELRLRP